MLNTSKQFFTRPTSLPTKSEIACTIPSPGFGIILISRDIAAPTPVSTMATSNTSTLTGIVPHTVPSISSSKFGIYAENKFINLVKKKLNGNCKASINNIFFKL
ncbi:hypothetical protein EUBVEN_01500 [Eubacterium ventriosum ATCC 27560]|uniref:Uncharacterized protein n=1 Tax=Eubacterium ventriosum ATCC 27560 TaxID=411463 RepID=A5Z718_9FIRM|nr:hypothetical protein EUBVEN_01500 [Eubacterium ventriosum ATCC 27560]